MLPSAESLQTWLAHVDREVLRLGTREYLIAARIRDEAVTQGWSQKTLGDALASALATDRDTWRELRRVFDAEFVPAPAPQTPRRWSRIIGAVLLSTFVAFALWLGLRPLLPGLPADVGHLPSSDAAEVTDLGNPDLMPLPADLGCRREPIAEPPRSTSSTNQQPVPLVQLTLRATAALALGVLLLCWLAMLLLRLPSYLRRRSAELIEEEQLASQRRKQQEEEQLAESRKVRERLVKDALATGAATRPQYRIDLQPPFGPDVVEDSATLLGRAYMAQGGRDLDIDGTLQATIANGGAARPLFLPGREVRELCLLYDDTTTRPYLPGFLKLVERWQRLGVRLSTYRFSRHPTTLTPVVSSATAGLGTQHGPPIRLADLLRQREGCSLLLFANRLVVRTAQRELDWPRTLRQATVCAWIDPDPRLDAERDNDTITYLEFLPRQLPRVPFTAHGLLAAARYIGTPAEGVRPPSWSPPPALSDAHMARWVDVWLGLGALVPDAALNQLEVLRQKLLSDALPDPRSIGRLVERLTELLGSSYSASKATIELGTKLRTQLLLKLFWNERALFRRGCAMLLDTIASEPVLLPSEEASLVHHETRFRRAWYEAGIAHCDGQDSKAPLYRLRGTASHEAAQAADEFLTQLSEGPSTEPLVEVVSRPPSLTWSTVRISTLLRQSALVAVLFPLLLLGGLHTVKTWPRRTVAVTTTYQQAQKTQPDEQVICPGRPTVTDPEPKIVAIKSPPVVDVKKPPSMMQRHPPSGEAGPSVTAFPELAPGPPPPDPPTWALHPPMVSIPSGRFRMGSPPNKVDENEQPRHELNITTPFYMSVTEVTQAQYKVVMGTNPSHFVDGADAPKRPVENVSWLDAVRYCNTLSLRDQLEACYIVKGDRVTWPKGQLCPGYRLPTETEWEYAARALKPWDYAGSKIVDEVAWYRSNSKNTTHVVGDLQANPWHLKDMSGNVWEWVWDWHNDSYTSAGSRDPTGPKAGLLRVHRGGSFAGSKDDVRVANRAGNRPSHRSSSIGFRLVRSIIPGIF